MPSYIYCTNVTDPFFKTVTEFEKQLDGILASSKFTSPTLQARLSQQIEERPLFLISDNGNYGLMKRVAKPFKNRAKKLVKQALQEIENFGNLLPETELLIELLVHEVEFSCVAIFNETDKVELIEDQLLIEPDMMVGLEDLRLAVLSILGLMQPAFQSVYNRALAYQKATKAIYTQQRNGKFLRRGNKAALDATKVYTVIHCMDYDTAFKGAKLYARKRKVDGVCLSLAGIMLNLSFIEGIEIGKRKFDFGRKLPAAYIKCVSLMLGLHKGLPTKNWPVHILGSGSPILLLILGLFTRHFKQITIDATSTFKDSDVGIIYGNKQAYLKMNMYKVAAYSLINNSPYESASPYFKAFEEKYPSDWPALRLAMGVTEQDSVRKLAKRLKENQDLVRQYIPYFSSIKGGGEQVKFLRFCRAGSNYLVLKALCDQISSFEDNPEGLKAWVEAEVMRYVNAKGVHKMWVAALQKAYDILKEVY